MGVGKGNVEEVVNIYHLFIIYYFYINRLPRKSTVAAAIPAFPLDIDSDSLPVSHHEDFSR